MCMSRPWSTAIRWCFLHGVKDGPANQSYGLQVAALAGIPKSVIEAARGYLSELERERDALRGSVSQQPQLPLFQAPSARAQHGIRPAPSPVLTALRAADPDSLSPREALDLVFKLRELDNDAS